MIEIRPIRTEDIALIHKITGEIWGSNIIVVHFDRYDVDDLPGLAAVLDDQIAGFLHYEIKGDSCEVLTLLSLQERKGVGSALMQAVEDLALSNGCSLMHLVTTNDNLHALGFYQRRGFHLSQLYPGRVDLERELKPAIPELGENGIPIRDEIRLEKVLVRPVENKGLA